MSVYTLEEKGIVAVLRGLEPSKSLKVIESLIEGGISTIEITGDSSEGLPLIQKVKKEFGKDIFVGAGTILDGISARQAISMGAEFIFAPALNKETITTARRYGVTVIPGVMTPTEMLTAMEEGANAVKVFPASVVGASFIKNVKGPLAHIPIVATGGINLTNVTEFITAGAVAVGVGGSLTNNDLVKNEKWKELTQLSSEYLEKVKEAKN